MLGKSWLAGATLLSLVTLATLACAGEEPTPVSTPTLTNTPQDKPELSVGVISTDLSLGSNRLAFFLLDRGSAPFTTAEADVSFYYPAEDQGGELQASSTALFRKWPLGDRGIYTTQVKLDQPGTWSLTVNVTGPDGGTRSAQGIFQVKEQSATPAIGSPAPRSKSKTARDVDKLEELTTASPPDRDLYALTIEEAVSSGKPLVVVFATPAFCQTATCGPQVQVIQGIKDNYGEAANFIHVEIWDNPNEIQGDLSKARTSPTVEEWGLATEPWTFIMDRQGRVAAKFEAFASASEIEEELARVLR